MRKVWYVVSGAALIVVAFLLAGFMLWPQIRPPYVVAVGTPIRHDDFLFTVTRIRQHPLQDGTRQYRVAVRVKNEAKIVNYRWRDTIAYVRAFDSGGFGHNFYPLTSGGFVLPPGAERTAELEFRIPTSVSSASLRFWDGIFMGDAFNGANYSKAIVPLEAYHPPFGT